MSSWTAEVIFFLWSRFSVCDLTNKLMIARDRRNMSFDRINWNDSDHTECTT